MNAEHGWQGPRRLPCERILEARRPGGKPEEPLPLDDIDLTTLSNDELRALRRRLLAEQAEEERMRVVNGGE